MDLSVVLVGLTDRYSFLNKLPYIPTAFLQALFSYLLYSNDYYGCGCDLKLKVSDRINFYFGRFSGCI
jgi:hypothetical protein